MIIQKNVNLADRVATNYYALHGAYSDEYHITADELFLKGISPVLATKYGALPEDIENLRQELLLYWEEQMIQAGSIVRDREEEEGIDNHLILKVSGPLMLILRLRESTGETLRHMDSARWWHCTDLMASPAPAKQHDMVHEMLSTHHLKDNTLYRRTDIGMLGSKCKVIESPSPENAFAKVRGEGESELFKPLEILPIHLKPC